MSKYYLYRAIILWSLCVPIQLQQLQGQTDTSKIKLLDTIRVTASRMGNSSLKTPYALSIAPKFYLQTGQRQLSVNEALQNVPGLIALNPDNFAQDLRVSIRGFGARAAFGIRGVKILVDGLPESTPDGQAQVDNLDLGAYQRMEIIRGSSSSLYGNAAGGVISFNSETVPTKPYAELGFTAGSFGLQRYQVKTGLRKGKASGFVHAAHTRTNGYRSQSGMESTLLYSYLNFALGKKTNLKLIYNYVFSPKADDPGALTRTEATENGIEARSRNVTFATGESVEQGKAGLVFTHQFTPNQQLNIKGFFLTRSFDNKLPFQGGGIVKLNRAYSGGGVNYRYQGNLGKIDYTLKAGIDIENQQDQRKRYNNLNGVRGASTLEQTESFISTGFFLWQDFDFSPKFRVNIGARYDRIQLDAQDQFLSNGDDSGNQSFQVFNPGIGVVYSIAQTANIYANVSTSFETPTLSELSANPNGAGGFNLDLKPQTAISYELGLKGLIVSKLRYTLALFHLQVQNELLPFELATFPQRTFYNNVGTSTRQGIETSLSYQIMPDLTFLGSYTFSHFVFDNFPKGSDDFSGKVLPGVPRHMGYAGLRYQHPKGVYASLNARITGSIFANNDNSIEDPGHQLVNLKLGWQKTFKNFALEPFGGINNLFNMKYTGNLRINAFGSRFYEPGASINFYAGLRVRH